MTELDQVKLAFDKDALFLLNIILGLIMFGVALDLKLDDFRQLLKSPKAPGVGLVAQFLLLPAMTFVLVSLLSPPPSIALGMMLVAACPGGNTSNFITHLGRGNTSVSVGMTAVSTAAALVMTPLNFTFWGGMYGPTAGLLQQVSLNALDMVKTVGMLLGIPVVVGMTVAAKLPRVAEKLRKPFKVGSTLFFFVFVAVVFKNNYHHFINHIGKVFWYVALLNALALFLGYYLGAVVKLPFRDCRATSIEVGIQNSGLALILIFDFFQGMGGMAVIAAWWGVWHIIAGMSLAGFWVFRDYKRGAPSASSNG